MILIAGAGIGGLTLGCALARAGRPFHLVERAPELRPAGAGIAMSANAFRALSYIGLEDQVRACGRELGIAAICDPTGKVLTQTRVSDIVPGGTVGMARSELQETLLSALGTGVQTGKAVAGYEQLLDGVSVRFEAGDTIDAELLVGADGLHSAVRRTMRGDEPVRYAGHSAWRALVDGVALEDPDLFTETWGAGRRFGVVPIGGGRVYWFAVADAPRGEVDIDARASLLQRFAGWHAPIQELITATPSQRIVRTDIVDRVPIGNWVDGRAVLLGDAAHPMTPNIGMGGCQAIEDAVVLADALTREQNIDAALARYQSRRVRRANGFVTKSYRVGQLAHLRSAPLRWLRDRAISAVPMRVSARALVRDLEFRV